MSDFDRAVLRTLGHEGGFSNHPDDPGGATNLGVTQATLNAAKGRVEGLPSDVRNLSVNQAKAIYEELYWKPVAALGLPFYATFQLFDAYVNHSPQAVWKMLQRALGITADGVLGPQTREAVQANRDHGGLQDVILGFLAERTDYYTDLSTFHSFGKGWTRRIANQLRYLAKDIV